MTAAGVGIPESHNAQVTNTRRRDKIRYPYLQRNAVDHVMTFSASPIVYEVLHSPGQPLDAATRAFMEPRFGCDFWRWALNPLYPVWKAL